MSPATRLSLLAYSALVSNQGLLGTVAAKRRRIHQTPDRGLMHENLLHAPWLGARVVPHHVLELVLTERLLALLG